jgi:hypothetical protein
MITRDERALIDRVLNRVALDPGDIAQVREIINREVAEQALIIEALAEAGFAVNTVASIPSCIKALSREESRLAEQLRHIGDGARAIMKLVKP